MHIDRRDFLRAAGLTAGVAVAGRVLGQAAPPVAGGVGGSMADYADKPFKTLRIGFVGHGMRGNGMLSSLLMFENVAVTAVCDLLPNRAESAAAKVVKVGQPKPAVYTGPEGYKQLCARDDVDLVYNCTPWKMHTPIALFAMENGKHATTEVPAAVTLDECWQLVETSEKTRRHCMMMENCCYGDTELFALNLIRNGQMGETVHGECAYIHDLRALKFAKENAGGYQGQWRLQEMLHRNGNLYPTHGLGPICQMMDVNRGDRLDYLSSMSSGQFGVTEYVEHVYGKDSPEARQAYALGDMNSTLIRTVKGKTILLQHDCTSPRPYSRINTISCSNGIFADYPPRLAIEHDEKGAHGWMGAEEYKKMKTQWEHPLWKRCGEIARKAGGHGGMDFIMNWRLVYCLVNGLPLDQSVYDAAAWSAMGPLSEKSVATRGASVDVPDFTRNAWKTLNPWGIVDIENDSVKIRGVNSTADKNKNPAMGV